MDNAQKHIGENIGITNTHVIIVELKSIVNAVDSIGTSVKDVKWNKSLFKKNERE